MFSPFAILRRAPLKPRNTALVAYISTRRLRCLTMGIPGEGTTPKTSTYPHAKEALSRGPANPTIYADETISAELTLMPGTIDEAGKRRMDMRLDYKPAVRAASDEAGRPSKITGETDDRVHSILGQAAIVSPDPAVIVSDEASGAGGGGVEYSMVVKLPLKVQFSMPVIRP